MTINLSTPTASARVNTRGAELISFVRDNYEYIWQGSTAHWSGQNPNLFPVIARVKGGAARFGGVAYPMDKHGFARNCEFSVVRQAADSVTLRLAANALTKKSYPFDFELEITHSIGADGFSTEYKIRNAGEGTLLANIGGHTGINVPFNPSDRFEDMKLRFNKTESSAVVYKADPAEVFMREGLRFEGVLENTDEIALNYPLFREDALMCANLSSNSVTLTGSDGHGVEMDFSGFPVIAFWTPTKGLSPFLCLEPWHGLPSFVDESGDFEDRPYLIKLPKNGEKVLRYKVKII